MSFDWNASPERQRALEAAIGANPNFTLYGQGVGDKVGELAEKDKAIQAAGFASSHRSVIGMSIIGQIYARHDIDPDKIHDEATAGVARKTLMSGSLAPEEIHMVRRIADRHRGPGGVIIRSSAWGDSAGTGVYDSEFSFTSVKPMIATLLKVAASYLRFDAVEFRRTAGLSSGFSAFVETTVGGPVDYYRDFFTQDLKTGYGPPFSGYGYTDSAEGPFIVAARGLAANLVNNSSLGIRLNSVSSKDLRKAMDSSDHTIGSFGGEACLYGNGFMQDGICIAARPEINDLSFLFAMMSQLQQAIGRPQYIEWALSIRNSQPIPTITQISDAKTPSSLDAINILRQTYENTLIETHEEIIGSGVVEAANVFYLENNFGIDALKAFNAKNKDYILIIGSNAYTEGANKKYEFRGADVSKFFPYSFYSNAAVVLPIWAMGIEGHTMSISSHFGGKTQLSGKLFGVIQVSYGGLDSLEKWRAFKKEFCSFANFDGYSITSAKLRVVADQRLKRLIIQKHSPEAVPAIMVEKKVGESCPVLDINLG